MSWKEICVGDLGQVITGNTPPKKNPEFYGDDYKFIKPTDIEIGIRHTLKTEECYSALAYEKYKKSLIPPLSTCVVTIGSIGKKITMADDECFVNQAINAVIPDQEKYDPYFVFYALTNLLPEVKKADTGASSGRENVSKSNFMGLRLEVPESLETQRKIGSILKNIDDLIENNLKRIRLLEEAAQNLYREWFVHMRFPGHESATFGDDGMPEGWEMKSIGEVGSVVTGKTPPTKNSGFYGGEMTFVKTPDMHNSVYVVSSEQTLSQTGVDIQSNKTIPPFSIMVSCIGTAGVVALTSDYCQTNQQINSLIIPSLHYTLYAYQYCKSLKPILEGLGSNGATMVNVNKGKFEGIPILNPNETIIDAFGELVKPMFFKILNIQRQNIKLKEARDILLPRLMNQTISV